MKLIPPATVSERVYIGKVLTAFHRTMPEATAHERGELARQILFRMRCWDVIWQFRRNNYSVRDALDAEFVE